MKLRSDYVFPVPENFFLGKVHKYMMKEEYRTLFGKVHKHMMKEEY